MLHFQLPEKLAQRRAVVAAQTIDGVEHRIEQAGFDVADIDAGLLYHLFLALARGFAQFAEPGPDPIDHLVIADVFLAHGRRLFPDCRSVQVRRLFPAQRQVKNSCRVVPYKVQRAWSVEMVMLLRPISICSTRTPVSNNTFSCDRPRAKRSSRSR